MKNLTNSLHILFNNLVRYSYPYEEMLSSIPINGVYILFEKGERYNEFDRIVQVGIGREDGNLQNRLNEHFIKKNKNRSIFRKNIGRTFLNEEDNPYLKCWNVDSTSRKNKEKYSKCLNLNFEAELEDRITEYIQSNITFCVFNVDTKEERIYWKSKIVATIAQSGITPSETWLGNNSPQDKIKKSGLWQEQHHHDLQLTHEELEQLIKIVRC